MGINGLELVRQLIEANKANQSFSQQAPTLMSENLPTGMLNDNGGSDVMSALSSVLQNIPKPSQQMGNVSPSPQEAVGNVTGLQPQPTNNIQDIIGSIVGNLVKKYDPATQQEGGLNTFVRRAASTYDPGLAQSLERDIERSRTDYAAKAKAVSDAALKKEEQGFKEKQALSKFENDLKIEVLKGTMKKEDAERELDIKKKLNEDQYKYDKLLQKQKSADDLKKIDRQGAIKKSLEKSQGSDGTWKGASEGTRTAASSIMALGSRQWVDKNRAVFLEKMSPEQVSIVKGTTDAVRQIVGARSKDSGTNSKLSDKAIKQLDKMVKDGDVDPADAYKVQILIKRYYKNGSISDEFNAINRINSLSQQEYNDLVRILNKELKSTSIDFTLAPESAQTGGMLESGGDE